jgi:hypothetical protein
VRNTTCYSASTAPHGEAMSPPPEKRTAPPPPPPLPASAISDLARSSSHVRVARIPPSQALQEEGLDSRVVVVRPAAPHLAGSHPPHPLTHRASGYYMLRWWLLQSASATATIGADDCCKRLLLLAVMAAATCGGGGCYN